MAPVVKNLAGVPEEAVRAIAVYVASVAGAPTPERQARARKVVARAKAESGVATQAAASQPGAAIYAGACAQCHGEAGRAPVLQALNLALSTALRNPRPDNAIYALAGALKQVEAYRFAPMINPATRAFFERIAENDKGSYGELIRNWLADPTDRVTSDLLEANELGYTRTRCVATQLSGGHAPNALPQKAEANVNCRVFPGVKLEEVRRQLQAAAGQDVTVELVDSSPASDVSPARDDIAEAYRAAVATRFKDANIVPLQSAGATDGAYLRSNGMPVYGVGGIWSQLAEPSGVHGLDERVLIEGFHGQVPIWEDILRRLAG
jgi:acetylornithine deacetylase/succinyl-diaminopimelate desuccinylase-like protein